MKGFAIVAGLCLAGVSAAAQQQGASQQQTGDPVADAARKAREAKKDAPKPKKVYTDDDVKKSAPEPAPTAAATPGDANGAGAAATGAAAGVTAATTPQPASDATKKENPNSEEGWRKRFKEQRDKIDRTEKEIDVLQREVARANTQYYADPQKAMKEQNSRAEINAMTAKIEAKRKELGELQQGLADLEDQLRKSGGNPGWAR